MVKGIISDMGNVLVYFDNKIFFNNIAPYSSFSSQQIGDFFQANANLLKKFDLGLVTDDEFFASFKEIMKLKVDKEKFFQIYNDIFSLNPEPTALLRSLKDKYSLVLLSNTDRQRFNFILEKFPQIDFFDEYVLSFQVEKMKPDPEIYQLALKKAGCRPEEAIFIDDRQENIETAQRLGLPSIHFLPGQTDLREELARFGVDID
ncbi:MAG: HAD family phosphatase [Candidatus Aminicenantes bacterium]|nr:HAD family phosphatase [Candidatus Aminicenantes bacterium]